MGYKFIKEASTEYSVVSPSVEMVYPIDGCTYSELLDTFECFLKACGYHFDGTVQIVEDTPEFEGVDPEDE